MKKLIVWTALLVVVSPLGACTSAQKIEAARSKANAFNASATVKCYSGGQVIYEGTSKGKVISEADSDGYVFLDAATDKLMEVSGECVITY